MEGCSRLTTYFSTDATTYYKSRLKMFEDDCVILVSVDDVDLFGEAF